MQWEKASPELLKQIKCFFWNKFINDEQLKNTIIHDEKKRLERRQENQTLSFEEKKILITNEITNMVLGMIKMAYSVKSVTDALNNPDVQLIFAILQITGGADDVVTDSQQIPGQPKISPKWFGHSDEYAEQISFAVIRISLLESAGLLGKFYPKLVITPKMMENAKKQLLALPTISDGTRERLQTL
jgi:hypothetical protein